MSDTPRASEEERLDEETERLIAAVGHAHWNHAGWNALVAEGNLRRRIQTLLREATINGAVDFLYDKNFKIGETTDV